MNSGSRLRTVPGVSPRAMSSLRINAAYRPRAGCDGLRFLRHTLRASDSQEADWSIAQAHGPRNRSTTRPPGPHDRRQERQVRARTRCVIALLPFAALEKLTVLLSPNPVYFHSCLVECAPVLRLQRLLAACALCSVLRAMDARDDQCSLNCAGTVLHNVMCRVWEDSRSDGAYVWGKRGQVNA